MNNNTIAKVEALSEVLKGQGTPQQIAEFISNRMDDGQFGAFATPEDVQVEQSEAEGWVFEFTDWLKFQD